LKKFNYSNAETHGSCASNVLMRSVEEICQALYPLTWEAGEKIGMDSFETSLAVLFYELFPVFRAVAFGHYLYSKKYI